MDFLHKCAPTILFALVLALSVAPVQGRSTNDILLNDLKHFNTNRHHAINRSSKRQARDYIRDTFVNLGLHTWTEAFDPDIQVVKGYNIVGMLPGQLARTRDDRLILIGAHYDTTRTSHGVDDNGSGVVAMLQIARQLTSKSDCARRYSVVFVAFDFEEWEDQRKLPKVACAHIGCGSRAFVANFSRYYNTFRNMSIARYGQLQGAIIMDTMMNYNSTPNSQRVAQGIEMLFPGVYDSITKNENRGDFLVAVGRYSDDSNLLNTFSYFYKKRKDTSEYKLQVFRLPFDGRPKDLDKKYYDALSHFLRSDHFSFWNEATSNRAIFLSDTANMRGYMRNCYHKNCDSLSHVTSDFLGFLAKSCDDIAMTTIDLIRTACKTDEPTPESSTGLPIGGSMAIGVLIGSFIAAFCCCFKKKKDNEDNEDNVNVEPISSATNPVFALPEETGGTENDAQAISINIDDGRSEI